MPGAQTLRVCLQRSRGPKSQAEKLQELEMSGLVDFTKEHARQMPPRTLHASLQPAAIDH